MKEPFEKVRNIYGDRLEEIPNRKNQRPIKDLTEILAYNRSRNDRNKKSSVVFNTLVVLAVGIFVAMLFLSISGTFTSPF